MSRSIAAALAAACLGLGVAAVAAADSGPGGGDHPATSPSTSTQDDGSGRRGGDDRRGDDQRQARRDDGREQDRRHGRHHGNSTLVHDGLVGSHTDDHAIAGLPPGGAPWVIDEGQARVRRNGKIRVRVEGLVIPAPQGNGTAGPVDGIAAAVACGDQVVATSKVVPLSDDGDARLRDTLTLPARCLAPAVLIRPQVGGTVRDAFVAVTGDEG
jgi:hypothetical protein